MWPLLQAPEHRAICEPGATDAERLDAALLLCWRLRQRVDDLETDLSERDQELEAAKATAIATEVRVARTLETIDKLRRGGIPGPETSREIVSPHRLERP
jgi:hypothetical protein